MELINSMSDLKDRITPSNEEISQSYVERFQFQLKINERIIIQRYFRINGFNEESLGSIDLKKAVDEIIGLESPDCVSIPNGTIIHDIKSKSRMFVWENYDPFYFPNRVDPITNINERLGEEIVNKTTGVITREKIPYQDHYEFIFLVDEKPVISKIFDANVFPLYIRKNVKIKELVYDICNKLSYVCSKQRVYRIGNVYDYQLAYYRSKPKEVIYEERKKESKWLAKQKELANKYLDDCYGYSDNKDKKQFQKKK